VLAWKIEDKLSKEEVLASYLNAVPFGRNAYGIEAAAQAYFGKTVNRAAPRDQQITDAEAMALVSMVTQPEPSPDDPSGTRATTRPAANARSRTRSTGGTTCGARWSRSTSPTRAST
jgi:membrane peptidoglycan carboxypeptidase